MAFPTVPTTAGNTLLSSTTTPASTTHTFPSQTTLAPAAGDLVIAIIVQYQGGTAGAEFTTWGGSFTERADLATVTALDQAVGVATKVAAGGETGTFTVTSAHSFKSVNFLMRIPAVAWHGTTAPEVAAAVRATGAVANPGALSPSWGAADTLWIAVAGHSETSTTGSPPTLDTAPTNYSGSLIVARAADAVGDITAGVSFRQNNAASEDAGTWTATNANRGNGIALTIAVRPNPSTAYTQPVNDTGTLADNIDHVWAAGQAVPDTGTLADDVGKTFRKVGSSAVPTEALTATDAVVQSLYTPTGVTCRHFDYRAVDYLVGNIGACSQTGAFTMGFLFRIRNKPGTIIQPLGYLMASDNTNRIGIEIPSSGIPQARVGNVARPSAQSGVGEADGWMIALVTKAAGTVNPFFHLYRGGTWTHDDTGFASADQPAQNHWQFGRLGVSGATALNGELAVAAVWSSDITAQIETLDDNSKTADWLALGPAGLLDFNQASVTTPLDDLTGNGATETARSGTSVVDYGPPGWVYGPGGAALTWSVPDTGTWADTTAAGAGKVLADAATWADARATKPGKVLADTGTLADASERKPGKGVPDTATATDAVAKAPKKPLADGATIADTVTHFWQAVQTVADSGTWAEAVKKSPSKNLADTATWADNVSQMIAHFLTQSVPDTFAVADALSRKPGKGLAETFALADALAKTARHAVADVGTWADNFGFGGGKIQSVGETLSIADAVLKAPKHPVADAISFADALAKAAAKPLADTGAWADARSLKPGKAQADSFALVDAVKNAPRKVVADALTIIDQVFPGGGKVKVVGDTFVIADALLKASAKPQADSFSLADAVVLAFGKRIADALGISDLAVPAIPDLFKRIAHLFDLTRATPAHETAALVAYESAAIVPSRTTALGVDARETTLSAAAYESAASANAYETGIIVVETDLEIT